MDSGLYIKRDNLAKIVSSIQTLTSHDCWVGYPESGPARDEPGITNAYIAFIMEHGSPAHNIPARAFMIPGINSVKDRAIALLQQAAIAGLNGEKERSMVLLNQLGLIGVSAVQRAITVGEGWPALSPRTLAARRRRGVKRTHPLIDSGQLRQHVEYVIRKKKNTFTLTDVSYMSKVKKM